MAGYGVKMQRTASTTLSVGNITAPGSGMRRFKIYYIEAGSEDTPGDNAYLLVVQRCSTAGTRSAITPRAFDSADAAAVTTAGENHTVEPTYTAGEIGLEKAFNQRANVQWYAPPGGELIAPATANNGYGLQTPTAPALKITATVHITEL